MKSVRWIKIMRLSWLGLLLGSSIWAQDTVRVTLHWAENSTPDTLRVGLDVSNPIAVRGLELNLTPLPTELTYLETRPTSRSAGLILADTLFNGSHLRVLLTSLVGAELPAGSGDVLEFVFLPDGAAPSCYSFQFGFVMISGAGTSTFPVIARDTCLALSTMAVFGNTVASATIIKVSPNPGRGNFTIHWGGRSITAPRFNLFDIRGRQIRAPQLRLLGTSSTSVHFFLNDVPAGIYLWQLQSETEFWQGKLVVF